MPYYGAEASVSAVREFLLEVGYGFNDEIHVMRAEKGLGPNQLPDVAEIDEYYPQDLQARSFPSMSIIYVSDNSEQTANSRMIDVEIDLHLVVLDLNVDGDAAAVGLAMARYRDALTKIFLRRLPMDKQGWTLNNGGSVATGRVIRATIDQHSLLFDPEIQASSPNMMLRTSLTVRLQEDY